MTDSSKRSLVVAVGFVFSGMFLWLAFRGTEFREVWESLRGADFRFSIPLVLLLGLSYWAKAIRWKILLRPVRRTTARGLFPAVIIGYAANNILPAQLGELLRMYVAGRKLRFDNMPILGTMLLERMFDFLTVLVLFGLSVAVTKRSPPELEPVAWFVGGAGVLMLLVSLAFFWRTEAFISAVSLVIKLLPRRIPEFIVGQMELARIGLGALRNPRLLVAAAATSGVQWLLMGGSVYMGILSVGLTVPISASMIVVAFTVAGLTLPSSPGFFGTIQLGFVLALAPFGVLSADAVAASVVWHVLAYLSVSVGGIFFLLRLGVFRR